jgi:diacylglycerol kinase family enzyme
MRRRFLLIDNPSAGYGRRDLGRRVTAELEKAGATVVRCGGTDETGVQARAAEAVRAGSCDAVIAAGGDGTIRLALAAVAGTRTPLGIIPLGTANVMAHEARLPRTPDTLASLLLWEPETSIKVPTANGSPFLLMIGAGFDGRVIETLRHSVKERIGKLAYAGPLVGTLARAPDALHVSIDGREHRASWAVIANARHYGGRFVIAPGTGVHEPGLEAVLFEGTDRRRLVWSLLALAAGRLASSRHVRRLPCTRAEIGSALPVPVQVDGDAFGRTPVLVEADGPMVRLILPPPARSR